MGMVTQEHFGANLILTNDSLLDGSGFRTAVAELGFSQYRYPGGGVIEEQTWANGGLARMFGAPMEAGDPNYIVTIREALSFSCREGTPISIVIPTFQFFNKATGVFDHKGFGRYIIELEQALRDVPDAKINAFEIGNEYWGSRHFGALTPEQYGTIADHQIGKLAAMSQRIAGDLKAWDQPDIGIQAGRAWSWNGSAESLEIGNAISSANRKLVDVIFQHSYPDLEKNGTDWQRVRALDPMKVYENIPGFRSDLKMTLSEFNVAGKTVTGVTQAAHWIEELGAHIDMGVDQIDHWGIAYKWLSSKLYDTKFSPAESDGGTITARATPLGMTFDIANAQLVGKSTMSDAEARSHIGLVGDFDITGFRDSDQRVVFLHNGSDKVGGVDLSAIPKGFHIAVHLLVNADSPHSSWYDESIPLPPSPNESADARGDMSVISGDLATGRVDLNPREMLVVIATREGRALNLEGAHNETDYRTGMVDDWLEGGSRDDVLRGHVGDDTLIGGSGRNLLDGGKGDDLLISNGGGDVILAGLGRDRIRGGAGDETILIAGDDDGFSRITTGGGNDIILATPGANLEIDDFSATDLLGLGGNFANAAALSAAVVTEGQDLVILLPASGEIRLEGWAGMESLLPDRILDFRLASELDRLQQQVFGTLSQDQIDLLNANEAIAAWPGAGPIVIPDATTTDANPAYAAGSAQDWGVYRVDYLTKGNDIFNAKAAASKILGLDGDDVIFGQYARDLLYGGNGADRLIGGGGSDYLRGGAGNDRLDGGSENDRMHGDTGQDSLNGSAGNDWLYGGSEQDLLLGGEGKDYLYGGTGNDRLFGGSENDYMRGDSGRDYLNGAAGNDRLYGGSDQDVLLGGTGRDYMRGGAGNDRLDGGSENDRMHGDTGQDFLNGAAGNDWLYGGSGNDYMRGDTGQDYLYGGTGNDRLYGGSGNDYMRGDSGRDYLYGGTGNDRLYGGSGNDYMRGDSGRDYLNGGDGVDWLYGGSDRDVLLGGADRDYMRAGAGNDRLYGGSGNDWVRGDSGRDYLSGGSGNDQLYGGSDRDVLRGGSGRDDFIFRATSDSYGKMATRDLIVDFKPNIDDLDLRAIDANTGRAGNQALSYSETQAADHSVWYTKSGSNVLVMADTDGDARADFAVLLLGVDRLTAADFLL